MARHVIGAFVKMREANQRRSTKQPDTNSAEGSLVSYYGKFRRTGRGRSVTSDFK